jgi:hypothetical protein
LHRHCGARSTGGRRYAFYDYAFCDLQDSVMKLAVGLIEIARPGAKLLRRSMILMKSISIK